MSHNIAMNPARSHGSTRVVCGQSSRRVAGEGGAGRRSPGGATAASGTVAFDRPFASPGGDDVVVTAAAVLQAVQSPSHVGSS
jgi:hypothetical protein